MPITVAKMIKDEEARAAGYLWTTENDPTWMRYTLDKQTGAMRGFHVARTQGSIPNVTPFLYQFQSVAMAGLHHEGVAHAIFADIGKEMLIREGEDVTEQGVAAKVAGWQDFMSNFGGDARKSDAELQSERFITYDKELTLGATLVRQGKRGALSMPRSPSFRVGARLSGFDAYNVAIARGLPPKLKVGGIGDPDIEQARKALVGVDRPSSHAVTWYGTKDSEQAKVRMQAAQSMPVLAGLIADRRSLAMAVDRMEPIQPVLIEGTGLSKAGVKRIGKLKLAAPAGRIFDAGERLEGEDALGVNRARHTQLTSSVPTDMALHYLSELPPDRTPQDDESWMKFNDILTAVAIPLHNATSIPVPQILEASKGNWIQYHAMLAKAADFAPENFDRRTMALVTVDALEAIEHFNRTAVLPQALASIRDAEQPEPFLSREFVVTGHEAATKLIIGKAKNVAVSMMEMSRRYASRIPAMMEIEGKAFMVGTENAEERFKAYGDDAYPVMTQDFTASNGLVVRPLRSGEELSRESERLGHCVGSYKSSARGMRCHIYSVQNADASESFSTFELRGLNGEDAAAAIAQISTVQHRAYHNGTPSDDCKKAKKEFLDAIKKGEIDINFEEINAWREYLSANGQGRSVNPAAPVATWKSALELDWEDDETRAAYWQEWGEVLGGKVAKSPNPGVIYTEKTAQDLVSAMSPRTAHIMVEEARRARAAREAEKAREAEPDALEP